MKSINDLPKIVGIDPLKSISYSTYLKTNSCILNSIPNQNVLIHGSLTLNKRIPNKQVIIGNYFHNLLEETAHIKTINVKELYRRFNEICDKQLLNITKKIKVMDKEFSSSIIYWSEIGDIQVTVWKILQDRLETNGKYYPEKKLFSKNGKVFGIIDELQTNNSLLTLTEYKSVYKTTPETISKYLDQVYLYAYLIYENYEHYPDHIYLKGLLDNFVQLNVDKKRSFDIYNKLLNHLSWVNSKIIESANIQELCSINPNICFNCRYRVICPSLKFNYQPDMMPSNKQMILIKIEKEKTLKTNIEYKAQALWGCIDNGEVRLVQNNKNIYLEPNKVYLLNNISFDKNTQDITIDNFSECYSSD